MVMIEGYAPRVASWASRGTRGPRKLGLACLGGFAALSLALGWLPLQLGLRRVRLFEM